MLVALRYICKVDLMGYAIFIVLGFVYLSFPLWVTLEPSFGGLREVPPGEHRQRHLR